MNLKQTILLLFIIAAIPACTAKKGCPTNGKNVGAEKLATGDPKASKDARKAGKYRMGKIPGDK